MILISVRQNKTNAAVIIEGPEGVLISKDENKPIITDNKPPIIDNLTICVGLLETFLAIAAGIINIPVIFLLSACAFNSSEIERKKENFSDFFLCFPENHPRWVGYDTYNPRSVCMRAGL